MGGDPDADSFLEYAASVAASSDILEVGIPFSDPVADGPAVQAAGMRSLASGTRVSQVLEACSAFTSSIPVVIMCYYNTVFRMGEEKFAAALAAAGASGLIVPDLPLEEGRHLRRSCSRHGIDHILMATPATPPDRARLIASAGRGFLYLVSRYGVTGERSSLPGQAQSLVRAYRGLTSLPVAVGFGISTPAHVADLAASGADGVVVGSAIVTRIGSGMEPLAVGDFVRSLRDAAVKGSGE